MCDSESTPRPVQVADPSVDPVPAGPTVRIVHLGLLVEDVSEATALYGSVLGVREDPARSGDTFAVFALGGVELALHSRQSWRALGLDPSDQQRVLVAYRTRSWSEVDRLAERLVRCGSLLVDPPHEAHGLRLTTLIEPYGHAVCVTCPMEGGGS